MAKKIKVLLVDDEESILLIIGERIKSWGYDLATAVSGKKAIGLLKSEKCDLVVLDYLMPGGMDGVATLKKIRKIDKDIPVIMFTAHPDTKVMAGTESLGVNAFIPKLSAYSDARAALRTALGMIGDNLRKPVKK